MQRTYTSISELSLSPLVQQFDLDPILSPTGQSTIGAYNTSLQLRADFTLK